MRPSQNKRMRGRNNNRKGPNPLSRNFESNGPDVKIRGTAHHIGEKYLQLARDAQSGGDPVMAESYLQHAEHYFRLIAAAQQAQQAAFGYQRQGGESEVEELEEEDDFVAMPDRFASPIERVAAQPTQQPFVTPPVGQMPAPERERPAYSNGDRQGYERQGFERQGYQERGNRQDRNMDRGQDRNGQDRNGQERNMERGERHYQDKRPPRDNRDNNEPRGQQRGRGGRDFRQDFRHDYRQEGRGEPRAPADDIASPGLPAFITAPVRIQQEPVGDEGGDYIERAEFDNEAPGFHLRPRRRRRPKQDSAIGEGPGEPASASDPVGD